MIIKLDADEAEKIIKEALPSSLFDGYKIERIKINYGGDVEINLQALKEEAPDVGTSTQN